MKVKKFIKEFKWFYKYFGGSSILGCRTSKNNLRWTIEDKTERNQFLETFYDECPSIPWLGETTMNEHYFQLKKKWTAVHHLIIWMCLFKKIWYNPYKVIKYTYSTIQEIYNINKKYEWYMNPIQNE